MKIVIDSQAALSECIGELRAMWGAHKFLRLDVKTGRNRSLDQNSISHVWYMQVAAELREDDAAGVKRFCKLHFGVPILRAEDEAFREFYDAAMKHRLSYEQKLSAMNFVPVTSLMSTEQKTQYLDAVRTHYLTRGVCLEFPVKEAS